MDWLNIGSLILGVTAWVLPFLHFNRKQEHATRWVTYSFFSFICCGMAILFQLMFQYHLVKIEDFSAMMDTAGFAVFAASVLFGVTIILNMFAWLNDRQTK
ncbi:hypothetical protein [Cytobacillus stercorigallinarum]|uniref:hypothetical protein n=1 Tax=Cytobacillus stercorigallinarum TaxID=2762240 RepID=UPI001CD84EF5|nr:hypothetical protein [Cytobacillus stercorigallinarum]